jgi:prophage regulatory protein
MPTTLSLIRRPAVSQKTGLPETTVYRRINAGLFPSPIQIGPNSVAWPEHEVNAVLAARIAGLPDAEIKALVAKLHRARAGFAKQAMAAVGGSE